MLKSLYNTINLKIKTSKRGEFEKLGESLYNCSEADLKKGFEYFIDKSEMTKEKCLDYFSKILNCNEFDEKGYMNNGDF